MTVRKHQHAPGLKTYAGSLGESLDEIGSKPLGRRIMIKPSLSGPPLRCSPQDQPNARKIPGPFNVPE